MKIKKSVHLLAAFLLVIALVACSCGSLRVSGETRIIVDVWGREVEIPANVERIIALGSGAPRIAAYLNAMDMVVGAEEYISQGVSVARDYNPVHYDKLLTLPFVGAGGGSGNNNAYPEEIIKLSPDVIIAGFDLEAANELQAQTGIPVVSVRHATGLAADDFYRAMRVFADVIGAQERCEALLAYIDMMKEDLMLRTSSVPENEKLKAYAGAVTWNGRRGFSGTYSNFGIFDAINAKNVAYNASIAAFYEANLESIVVWNPDVIFLDPGNMDLVNDEYRINPNYFNSLRAVREGNVYTMPAFNFAGTNITYAFMNAYYAGIILFPEQFADVDIAKKSEEILMMFLGVNTYELMAQGGLYYGKIMIGE
ncbi:MAG: ABC transporter substrate-binding protein [Dehalococcoidia bacterium]|nr:ABC transporter substrate-binding protein [Dehalococcoidia bacterium]